jgi:PP-loop superfamily ATP-utilizing enzyme
MKAAKRFCRPLDCERRTFIDAALLDALSEKIKKIGFIYVAFELSGYATGSMPAALYADGKDGGNG